MKRKETDRPNQIDILLGKLASGDLSDDDARRLRAYVERDPTVNRRAAETPGMVEQVRAARGDAFAPGFTERVMDRIYPDPDTNGVIAESFLARLFARLAPLAIAIALVAGVYNVATTDADSPLDAVLGIESVTAATAYENALTMW